MFCSDVLFIKGLTTISTETLYLQTSPEPAMFERLGTMVGGYTSISWILREVLVVPKDDTGIATPKHAIVHAYQLKTHVLRGQVYAM
jgi:hypothetical protein